MNRDEMLKTVLPEVIKYYLIEMKKSKEVFESKHGPYSYSKDNYTSDHDKTSVKIADLAASIVNKLGDFYEEEVE